MVGMELLLNTGSSQWVLVSVKNKKQKTQKNVLADGELYKSR